MSAQQILGEIEVNRNNTTDKKGLIIKHNGLYEFKIAVGEEHGYFIETARSAWETLNRCTKLRDLNPGELRVIGQHRKCGVLAGYKKAKEK